MVLVFFFSDAGLEVVIVPGHDIDSKLLLFAEHYTLQLLGQPEF